MQPADLKIINSQLKTVIGCNLVVWKTGGKVVYEGNIIDLNELEETFTYVRAKLFGDGETVTGTQPFGIRQRQKF